MSSQEIVHVVKRKGNVLTKLRTAAERQSELKDGVDVLDGYVHQQRLTYESSAKQSATWRQHRNVEAICHGHVCRCQ